MDREEEEQFLLDRFSMQPETILFIYGPKSSGKTTLIEYLVENVLERDKGYYVNYVNFRGHAISNYDSFLDVYFQPIEDENKSFIEKALEYLPIKIGRLSGNASLPPKGFQFGLNIELYNRLTTRQIDPFNLLLQILEKIRKKRMPILILDEVQTLEDIYMNGESKKKHLLTEFFNFLVRLSKETHLAHVVVMTSETLFLEKIYNHSKLAETSDFYKIDHLDYSHMAQWLRYEGIENKEVIDLIWEYVGGSVYRLNKAIRVAKKGDDLKRYLQDEAKIYRGKISHFIAEKLDTAAEMDKCEELLKIIVKNGFLIRNQRDKLQTKILNKAIEYEFLFLDPKDERIIFNSQIIRKGAEMYLNTLKK